MLAGLGSLAAFIAVGSFFLWLNGLGAGSLQARLKRMGHGQQRRALDAPFRDRVVVPVLSELSALLVQALPHSFVARTSRWLLAAGSPLTTQGFFALVILTGGGIPALLLAALLITGSSSGLGVPAILMLAILGLLGPFAWLRRRVRQRKLAIWKGLADAFDLVTISVEAGLGLDGALRLVAEKLKNPLADEIRQMLTEVALGRPRRDALMEMAERTDVPELIGFVNALVQAEQLGTSIGRVLRAQSAAIRTRRRQRAEETARRAPVKMVFPLVLFIMPSFFIVVLGPTAIRLANYLGN